MNNVRDRIWCSVVFVLTEEITTIIGSEQGRAARSLAPSGHKPAMSWLLSFKGLSLGKGRKNKRSGRAEQDSQGRKRLRPSSSCHNTGSYDLATAAAVEEGPNRFSWASSPYDEGYMNNDVGKTKGQRYVFGIEQ